MASDFDQLTAQIGLVVSRIVQTDLALLRGYSEAKARAIASYTMILGDAYARGAISEEEMRAELVELERMVVRFVRNIEALAVTTVERLLQGIANLLFTTLTGLTGVPQLPLPRTPTSIWGVALQAQAAQVAQAAQGQQNG